MDDSPVMNWTEDDVKRFGVKLELKDNHTAPKPEVRRVGHALLPTVNVQSGRLRSAPWMGEPCRIFFIKWTFGV